MAVMEFLSQNLINTTTLILVDSASGTTDRLINRSADDQYETDGYASDTSTIISIGFSSPTIITNAMIQNHNLKDFRIFYDSTTANSLGIFSGNSATSTYTTFASITVSSVQLQMDSAMTSVEKAVGQFIISEKKLAFNRNPTIKNFKPKIDRTQIRHVMADGGITLHNIRDKYKVNMKFTFITESFYDSLLTIYEEASPIYYIPFPTTSAWLGNAYEMVWSKDFDFKYSTNVRAIGYSGQLMLEETSNA